MEALMPKVKIIALIFLTIFILVILPKFFGALVGIKAALIIWILVIFLGYKFLKKNYPNTFH